METSDRAESYNPRKAERPVTLETGTDKDCMGGGGRQREDTWEGSENPQGCLQELGYKLTEGVRGKRGQGRGTQDMKASVSMQLGNKVYSACSSPNSLQMQKAGK